MSPGTFAVIRGAISTELRVRSLPDTSANAMTTAIVRALHDAGLVVVKTSRDEPPRLVPCDE